MSSAVTLSLTDVEARTLHLLLGVALPFAGDESRLIALRLQDAIARQLRAAEPVDGAVQ